MSTLPIDARKSPGSFEQCYIVFKLSVPSKHLPFPGSHLHPPQSDCFMIGPG